ncbi:MAG: aminopeptidase [Candidatus Doudnabacteria bacterium]|nr:aminopeptidase [Candidatus Doudnabacteria bacterium]
MKTYTPPKRILENYAKVLVNFALGGGKGIKHGDVVRLYCNEYAKPLYFEIYKAVLKSGGHVLSEYHPDADKNFNFEREFFLNAQDHQLKFFPAKYMRGIIDDIDHMLMVICETDKKPLQGIDPVKIMTQSHSRKPYMDWRNEKEHAGKFTWTLGLYGSQAMAAEAGMTEKQYWDQIIKACFLDAPNPIAKWREVYKKLDVYINKLNKMQIDRVHITGPDANLWIKIGDKRQWLGGSGRNIPSFEIFTSPDWRGTNGWMRFNQPLYRYGNLIEGIRLEFKDGKVVKATAKKNEKMLKQMIATLNADKLGEFSMTDGRFSRITKFMAETLYDENIGGREGNTHVALGASYADTFAGNPSKLTKADKTRLGFNDSSVHTDVVSTAPRTITAYFKSGAPKIIYQNGQYTF